MYESIKDYCDRYNLGRIVLSTIAITFVLFNIIRLNYNLVWVDEGFSVLTATSPSGDDLLEKLAWERSSSPFLYYSLLYVFTTLFGHHIFTYQLFSLIPYVLILIVTITVIRKEFGFFVALSFMILCSFLFSSIVYITEIRAYEWAVLFVLMSFLYLYRILNEPSKKNYVLFLLFSLLAACTHYFASLAVGLLFFVLILNSLFVNKSERKNVAYITILIVALYAPWLIYCVSGMMNSIGGFWLKTTPSLSDCLTFLFANEFGLILCITMVFFSALVLKNNFKTDPQKRRIEVTPVSIWVVAGIFAIFGSIAIGQIVSRVLHPVLVLRYLYPVSIIAWLLFSYAAINWLKDVRKKTVMGILIVAVLLIITVPQFVQISSLEQGWNNDVQDTIELIGCITEDDVVLSDEFWVANSYFQEYYPDVTLVHIDRNDIPKLDDNCHYYILVNGIMSQTTIEDQLLEQGYTVNTVEEYLFLGAGYRHQTEIGDLLTQYYSLYDVCPVSP